MDHRRPEARWLKQPTQQPMWLAAVNGRRLPPRREPPVVNPINEPEVPLTVEFVGLTEAEQRAALAAFPGGKRFILAKQQ